MKTLALAAALVTAAIAAPALAQTPAPAADAAAGKISVETTPIGDIIKNEKAKAALEKALPEITQFYDQIATMTLAQVAPMSQGAIDDAKLKALQADFDSIKSRPSLPLVGWVASPKVSGVGKSRPGSEPFDRFPHPSGVRLPH